MSSLLGGLGFVSVLIIVHYWMYELVFQFIVGAILLFAIESLVKRYFHQREPGFVENIKIPVLEELTPPVLGLLRSLMQLHAERNRYFPIQQNMLLVISLILLPGVDPGKDGPLIIRILIYAVFGSFYIFLKTWESFHNQNQRWSLAARAVQKFLQEKAL